jgi:hypothetical protein
MRVRLYAALSLLWFSIFYAGMPAAAAKPPPPSFRDSEDLSQAKLRRLTRSASSGDSGAALSLARYYWLIRGDIPRTERFLQIAARGGSQKACDALIAFYVRPGGVFRPKEALALRHRFVTKFNYRSPTRDDVWAYESSLEFRYSSDPKIAFRRRTLLELADSLGSKHAGKELSDFNRFQRNRVRVSPSSIP